jgi:hypothetical protein
MHKSWETTLQKRNRGQKLTFAERLSYIEKDCFEISQNYCSTGNIRTEYSLILNNLFPQNLSNMGFTNPSSTVRLQLLNL